jgi:hypothetical protein
MKDLNHGFRHYGLPYIALTDHRVDAGAGFRSDNRKVCTIHAHDLAIQILTEFDPTSIASKSAKAPPNRRKFSCIFATNGPH